MNAISAIHSQALYQRPSFAQPVQAKEAQGGESTNPAQSARAAVAGRPDLADKPFGSLVSLFAKGLPLPPFENSGDVPALVTESSPSAS